MYKLREAEVSSEEVIGLRYGPGSSHHGKSGHQRKRERNIDIERGGRKIDRREKREREER